MNTRAPRPWWAEGFENSIVRSADGFTVALTTGHTVGQMSANARLIAAAPDLLDFAEAAGGFIAWAKDHGADPDAMYGLEKMRRTAITRATGENL